MKKINNSTVAFAAATFASSTIFADKIDPATPQKTEYYITASDEFSGTDINKSIFSNRYLPHWTLHDSSATYALNSGILRLKIDKETQPWDPEYDGQTVVSGLQTAEKDWLHKWTNYPNVNYHENTILNHIQKYGYFEIRAKV